MLTALDYPQYKRWLAIRISTICIIISHLRVPKVSRILPQCATTTFIVNIEQVIPRPMDLTNATTTILPQK